MSGWVSDTQQHPLPGQWSKGKSWTREGCLGMLPEVGEMERQFCGGESSQESTPGGHEPCEALEAGPCSVGWGLGDMGPF